MGTRKPDWKEISNRAKTSPLVKILVGEGYVDTRMLSDFQLKFEGSESSFDP